MEESIKLTEAELEAALKAHRSKAGIFKIVTYGAGIAMILFAAMGLIPVAILCLIIAMAGSWQLSKHTGAIKKMLGDNVVIGSLRKVFDTVEYDPFGKISGTEIDSAHMAFPFTHQGSGGSDLVRAAYKGLPVTFSDVELFQIDSQYDEELQQWRDTKQRVFQGQWFVCGLDAPLSGAVRLSSSSRTLRRQLKKGLIETADAAFNERFLVTADNAQETLRLLTPGLMRGILALADRSGGEVYMSFLPSGALHIAVQTGRGSFELGKGKLDMDAMQKKCLRELEWFTGMLDMLRAEGLLGAKEDRV